MTWLRFWLACTWLVFATAAPAHATTMTACPACAHMAMSNMPAPHAPVHDDAAMPCCSVPAAIIAEATVMQAAGRLTLATLSSAPVLLLHGLIPASDPRPPKKFEA